MRWLLVMMVMGFSGCGDDSAVPQGAARGDTMPGGTGQEGGAGGNGESNAGNSGSDVGQGGEGGSGGEGGPATGGTGQGGGVTGAVACSQCFPLEELPANLQKKAEGMLLEALDTEALFTLVGGLKPMSTGFLSLEFPAEGTEPASVEEARRILATFHCSTALSADLQIFHSVLDGKKSAEGVIFRRPRFDDVVKEYPVFQEIGVGVWEKPLQVVDAVDKDPTTKRFRAYGYLFGYPNHAVDFFVQAAEEEEKTGQFVPRDFFQIPTFAKLTGGYTYAVPKGYQPASIDLDLRNKAADILASYQKRRIQFIGKDKAGPVALLRTWFDNGTGQCSPDHASIETNSGTYQLPSSCWTGLKSCNPLSNEGCDGAEGWACDLSEEGFQCFEPPNSQKLGDKCNNQKGPYCEGGNHCDGNTCAAFCCTKEDCQGDEECDPLGQEGSLGICRKLGSCKPPGGFCTKDEDCCSQDCHVDHCH
ncbi:MAG: hypothetical protein RMJ98_06475 [Myxococcales bacterium]|nr:hypothetical protein [Polyangiaceae bacterium]MDW8248930.1 hypothetical protein [Myxococcales bacterium]